MSALRALGSLLIIASFAAPAPANVQSAAPSTGAVIYQRGILPSGEPLTAVRDPDLKISGAAAACSNCHRRSGLGEIEGNITIPPISGPYLFHPRANDRDHLDLPHVDGMRVDRDPYTTAGLARAIRDGVGADGKPLSYLMPRYSMSDGDLAVLIEYLTAMTPAKVPGVVGSVINFATIVTPDADPAKRQAMLSVLYQYFSSQNAFAMAASPGARLSEKSKSDTRRRWQLHVWELSGAPVTWDEQLRRHLAQEPVYAVISGLGGKDWAPVHRFCEASSLPCIFPNVDLPVVAEHDFYSLYFSRGVLLEADLLARELAADKTAPLGRRVVQIFRADDVGEAAAKALHAALNGSGTEVIERPFGNAAKTQISSVLDTVRPGDAVILWLRSSDIAALSDVPVRGSMVLMSGLMGGLDSAPLPADWRRVTRMAYPVDLPDRRTIRVDYALGWMMLHRIPVVAERVQTDTYVACTLVLETLGHMSGSFVPDYLVERLEGMLEHQLASGYFPRLALAPNERFASKGGYMVHFAGPTGHRVVSDADWRVP
jgi:hypothetical protein